MYEYVPPPSLDRAGNAASPHPPSTAESKDRKFTCETKVQLRCEGLAGWLAGCLVGSVSLSARVHAVLKVQKIRPN